MIEELLKQKCYVIDAKESNSSMLHCHPAIIDKDFKISFKSKITYVRRIDDMDGIILGFVHSEGPQAIEKWLIETSLLFKLSHRTK